MSSQESRVDQEWHEPGARLKFGRSLRCTESGTNDDEDCPLAALGADGAVWKTSQIRAAAKMTLLSRDAPETW